MIIIILGIVYILHKAFVLYLEEKKGYITKYHIYRLYIAVGIFMSEIKM